MWSSCYNLIKGAINSKVENKLTSPWHKWWKNWNMQKKKKKQLSINYNTEKKKTSKTRSKEGAISKNCIVLFIKHSFKQLSDVLLTTSHHYPTFVWKRTMKCIISVKHCIALAYLVSIYHFLQQMSVQYQESDICLYSFYSLKTLYFFPLFMYLLFFN